MVRGKNPERVTERSHNGSVVRGRNPERVTERRGVITAQW